MENNSNSLSQNKTLFVFDMDHTILCENSDTYVFDLFADEEIKKKFHSCISARDISWAEYMQTAYIQLKKDKVTLKQIKELVLSIKLNRGFKEIFEFIRERQNSQVLDCIVVTGANTLFAQWVLDHHKVNDLVKKVVSNIAKPCEEKLIDIVNTHSHDCRICDSSQCKKKILTEYLKENENKYNKMAYFGDGSNDYCPATIFNKDDFLYPRIGFPLNDLLKNKKKKEAIKCEICPWNDGFDILTSLKKNF